MPEENSIKREELLRSRLHGRFAAARLFYLEEVDSTNTFLKARAQEEPDEAIAFARTQTAGVGRRGHTFATAPGEALHLSFLLRQLPEQPTLVSLIAGVAVQQALFTCCGSGFALKWPNDPLGDGRKIGGILCEAVRGGVVCGIGINLLLSARFFEQQGLPHAASIQMIKGSAPSPETLAAAIAEKLEQVLTLDIPTFLTVYAAHCATLGAQVRVLDSNGLLAEGVAECITPQGELVVRTAKGRMIVRAGDVSVRGKNGYV